MIDEKVLENGTVSPEAPKCFCFGFVSFILPKQNPVSLKLPFSY
jgi:hypothetical protein